MNEGNKKQKEGGKERWGQNESLVLLHLVNTSKMMTDFDS